MWPAYNLIKNFVWLFKTDGWFGHLEKKVIESGLVCQQMEIFLDDLPECVEDKERIVELWLPRKMLQREEDCIAEPQPGDQTQR